MPSPSNFVPFANPPSRIGSRAKGLGGSTKSFRSCVIDRLAPVSNITVGSHLRPTLCATRHIIVSLTNRDRATSLGAILPSSTGTTRVSVGLTSVCSSVEICADNLPKIYFLQSITVRFFCTVSKFKRSQLSYFQTHLLLGTRKALHHDIQVRFCAHQKLVFVDQNNISTMALLFLFCRFFPQFLCFKNLELPKGAGGQVYSFVHMPNAGVCSPELSLHNHKWVRRSLKCG
jgi:hypothetical protein